MIGQRESTFRLESTVITEEAQKKLQKVKDELIKVYDLINDFTLDCIEDNIISNESKRCFEIAKTKLQESLFWTNCGLSYDPKSFSSEQN